MRSTGPPGCLEVVPRFEPRAMAPEQPSSSGRASSRLAHERGLSLSKIRRSPTKSQSTRSKVTAPSVTVIADVDVLYLHVGDPLEAGPSEPGQQQSRYPAGHVRRPRRPQGPIIAVIERPSEQAAPDS